MRVRLSNQFGDRPVSFHSTDVAERAEGADLVASTQRPVMFAGQRSVTIAPGTSRISDSVDLTVGPGTDLAVTFFTSGLTGPVTCHSQSHQTSFKTPGDKRSAPGTAFATPFEQWHFLSGVDVLGPSRARSGAVIAFGDSITDGVGSTVDANARWPDQLARRIAGVAPDVSVVNAGIRGNSLLRDSSQSESAQRRFDRDVLGQTGARSVIVALGINDINENAGAASVIRSLRSLARRAHAGGLRAFVATLTPSDGGPGTPREAVRAEVNAFLRSYRTPYDGLFDFAGAVTTTTDDVALRRAFDSGDGLHPNDAGYRAIGRAINPDVLLATGPGQRVRVTCSAARAGDVRTARCEARGIPTGRGYRLAVSVLDHKRVVQRVVLKRGSGRVRLSTRLRAPSLRLTVLRPGAVAVRSNVPFTTRATSFRIPR